MGLSSFRKVSAPFPHRTHGYHFGMRLSLTDYRRRRRSDSQPSFVIERDAAGGDHYDLRLEIDGALVSWTIPMDGRMARRTEDHPLEDAESEAVGDRGTYVNATPYDMTECLERGDLSFFLCGEGLRGWYTLTRVHDGNAETWLLIRRKDDEDANTLRQPAHTEPTPDDSS